MIVSFIYRHVEMSTIYYGKYIGECVSYDDNVNLVDFLSNVLCPYFSIQFGEYVNDDKIVIGIMGLAQSSTTDDGSECFSESEKKIFDLLYIRENVRQIPDVYLNGKLVKEIIEE